VADSQRRCSDYILRESAGLIYLGICLLGARKTKEKPAERNGTENKKQSRKDGKK
jgi:hypothetical protein